MIKQSLTILSLVAASVAMVNAAAVSTTVINFGGSESPRSTWMTTDSTWNAIQYLNNGGSKSAISLRDTSGESSLSYASGAWSAAGAAGSFTTGSGVGSNGPYVIPDALKALSQGVFGSDAYDNLWGGGLNTASNLTLSGLTANTSYTIYILSARANAYASGAPAWTLGGGETGLLSNINWNLTKINTVDPETSINKTSGSGTISGGMTFEGSPLGLNGAITAFTFDTGETVPTNIKLTSSIANMNLNGMIIKASAIPEPSLFGLLAGIGALALVGSRRRRK